MFVINISAIIAVGMKIRAARGTEMIVVRDMGEPLQPAVGPLLTVSMSWEEVSNPKQYQRADCNSSVSTSQEKHLISPCKTSAVNAEGVG